MSSLIEMLAFDQASSDSFESTQVEYEVEIYLKGYDIEQIRSMSLSKEVQEQWGIYVPKTEENASSGSIRVRKTMSDDGEVKFIRATKTDMGDQGKLENESFTEETEFEQFKKMADQGLIKTRYSIPHELKSSGVKIVLEVDVFQNKKGEDVEWVKIDAELEQGMAFTPDEIPLTYEKIIYVTPELKSSNPSLKKEVGELYEKYFRSKNVYVEDGE